MASRNEPTAPTSPTRNDVAAEHDRLRGQHPAAARGGGEGRADHASAVLRGGEEDADRDEGHQPGDDADQRHLDHVVVRRLRTDLARADHGVDTVGLGDSPGRGFALGRSPLSTGGSAPPSGRSALPTGCSDAHWLLCQVPPDPSCTLSNVPQHSGPPLADRRAAAAAGDVDGVGRRDVEADLHRRTAGSSGSPCRSSATCAPSADSYPVIVSPERTSRSHRAPAAGAARRSASKSDCMRTP